MSPAHLVAPAATGGRVTMLLNQNRAGSVAIAPIIDTSGRAEPADKRLINCETVDVNQLMPLKYEWAWEHYVNGCANHWLPTEVPMAADVALWKGNRLTADERLVVLRNL